MAGTFRLHGTAKKENSTKPKIRTGGETNPGPWRDFIPAARDRLHSGAGCWLADTESLAHLLAALGALCGFAGLAHFCRFGALVALSVHRHDSKASDDRILAIVPFPHPCFRQILSIYPEQLQLTWRVIFTEKHCGET